MLRERVSGLLLAVLRLLAAVLLPVGGLRAPATGLGRRGRLLLRLLLGGATAAPRLGQDGVRVLVHALLAIVLRPGSTVVGLACRGVHIGVTSVGLLSLPLLVGVGLAPALRSEGLLGWTLVLLSILVISTAWSTTSTALWAAWGTSRTAESSTTTVTTWAIIGVARLVADELNGVLDLLWVASDGEHLLTRNGRLVPLQLNKSAGNSVDFPDSVATFSNHQAALIGRY